MKKLIFVFLLIPILLFAQYNIDGRRIYNGTVKNAALATSAVDGGVMLEATRVMWFPISIDSLTTTGVQGSGGWFLPSANSAGVTNQNFFRTLTFDADGGTTGDDIAYLTFVCPDDYETDSMELYLYWFHLDDDGAAADEVTFDGTVNAIADAEDCLGAGTGMTAVADVAASSDSALYIVNLDPEVETITAGDLVVIQIFVDESASSLDSGELVRLIGAKITYEAKDE